MVLWIGVEFSDVLLCHYQSHRGLPGISYTYLESPFLYFLPPHPSPHSLLPSYYRLGMEWSAPPAVGGRRVGSSGPPYSYRVRMGARLLPLDSGCTLWGGVRGLCVAWEQGFVYSLQLQSHWRGGHAAWLLQSRESQGRPGLPALCRGREGWRAPPRLHPQVWMGGTQGCGLFCVFDRSGEDVVDMVFPTWPLCLTKFWQKEQGICGSLLFCAWEHFWVAGPSRCKAWLLREVETQKQKGRGSRFIPGSQAPRLSAFLTCSPLLVVSYIHVDSVVAVVVSGSDSIECAYSIFLWPGGWLLIFFF